MRKLDLHRFKEILKATRSSLLRRMERTRGETAGTLSERNAALHSLMESARLLWKVDFALKGIEDGTYGTCLFCQVEIPAKRLDEVPWSTYCFSCEKLSEVNVNRQSA